MLDEFMDLMVNGAEIEERDKALSNLRSVIAKLELSRGGETPKGKSSFLGGFLGIGKADPLKRIKKAALQSLDELRAIIGGDYADAIETLRKRIGQVRRYRLSIVPQAFTA